MNYSNLYATLSEFQSWITMRGQPAMTADAGDDGVILSILNKVSRWIEEDKQTARYFYPRYETRYFDVPFMKNQYYWVGNNYYPTNFTGQIENLDLILDEDLLEAITVTNGDATVLSSIVPVPYQIMPLNTYPKDKISITQYQNATTSYYWIGDSSGNWRGVISVYGLWGFRRNYAQRGWVLGGTLGAAITDTTGLSATLTAGHSLSSYQILKIDTEIVQGTISTNTLTINQRGDNGSTAATHLNGANIYYWSVQDEMKDNVLQIAQRVYSERSGQASAGQLQVTASGVVIRPSVVPDDVQSSIESFRRTLVW